MWLVVPRKKLVCKFDFFFISLVYVLMFCIIILMFICFCRKIQVMEKKRKRSDEQSKFLAKKSKEEFEKEYECKSCQQIIYGGNSYVSKHL